MNLTELKQDFYKRFNASDNFLHFTSNGIFCTLLGCTETEYTPALGCTLSMGVKMFSRRLDGRLISLQENKSNKSFSYIFGSSSENLHGDGREYVSLFRRLEPLGLSGTQVLFEYSVPEFLPRREIFFLTLVQALEKSSDIELEPLNTAALASLDGKLNIYLGILYSKKGYCTLVSSGTPKNFPLPLTGYKILSVHCTQRQRTRSKQINYAFEHVRRLFPHITSIADITPEMLTMTAPNIKSRQALRYMCHLADENTRIKTAYEALKHCNSNELFRQMKLSQASMERYWDLDNEHIFLANCCKPLEGVKAVRAWENGIAVIADENMIDHIINIVRHEFENNIGYQPSFCVSDII